jgi:hypothetical protein
MSEWLDITVRRYEQVLFPLQLPLQQSVPVVQD